MQREIARFVRHHRSLNHSQATIDWYTNTLKYYREYLERNDHPTDLDGLKLAYVRDWLDEQREQGRSQKTLATRVLALKGFCAWLVEEEYLDKHPLARLKVPKVDDRAKDTLSLDEVDQLLAVCDRRTLNGVRDRAIMLLLLSTGLRAAEIVALQAADIDWDKGLILIRRGKGGKFRVVPLGGKAEQALDKYLAHRQRPDSPHVFLSEGGEPLTYSGLRMMLQRKGQQAGVHGNLHKWRHTAAVEYLRGGGRVETLRAMLGHTKIDMTLHYARIAGVDLTEAHATADPARRLKTRV